jgi:aspartate-semialdehyde dehydrogenase
MTDKYKIAIVGAASLRGKELNEVLNESAFASADFSLMDDESQLGQLEAVGDEVTFIQRIEPDAFASEDFVFFTGSEEATLKHWKSALKAGASILDLTYALESEPGVLVRAPWVRDALREDVPDGQTEAKVDGHRAGASGSGCARTAFTASPGAERGEKRLRHGAGTSFRVRPRGHG